MQTTGKVILGAGGFARETFTIYVDKGMENEVLAFVVDKKDSSIKSILGRNVYDFSFLENFENEKPELIAAIGSTRRFQMVERCLEKGFLFDTLVHPSVVMSRWVKLGAGTIVTAGTILTTQVEIGNHVILNLSSSVGHDTRIGDFSTISPGARISGNVNIGREVFVGNNASINEHVEVGDGSVIAAGSVVIRDIPELCLVAGVPASIIKTYNSRDDKPW